MNEQSTISNTIIGNDIDYIEQTYDGEYYYLPNVKKTIELEISTWKDLDYPPESYAGQQLIDFLSIKNVPGDIDVSLLSIADDGFESFMGEFNDGASFTYKSVEYFKNDVFLIDDVYVIKTDEGLVPVGITNSAGFRTLRAIVLADFLESLIGEDGKIDYEKYPYAKAYEKQLSGEDPRCFAAGTQIDMADGSTKTIETIQFGDDVMAYDPEAEAGRGGLKPARVTRTMINQVPHLLDFHGVRVTPGHATLSGDGPHSGKHIPLMDILTQDGAVVNREGDLLRAATNLPVGSEGDQFVEVAYITSKSQKTYFRGRMRAGTLTLDAEGKTHRVLDALKREGYRLLPDGLIAKDGETPHPLYWFGELPKPADYVLAKSGLTLAELYSAGEEQERNRPVPVSSSKIGAELGAIHAGMWVN